MRRRSAGPLPAQPIEAGFLRISRERHDAVPDADGLASGQFLTGWDLLRILGILRNAE